MVRLNADYQTLQQLNSENPHPGSGTVDNIAEARNQQRQLRETSSPSCASTTSRFPRSRMIRKTRRLPIAISQPRSAAPFISCIAPPKAPASPLPRPIALASRRNNRASPLLSGSPPLLAVQLGDIKAICDILIEAKVNSIDNIRRERVPPMT
jgi:hypothetical protein